MILSRQSLPGLLATATILALASTGLAQFGGIKIPSPSIPKPNIPSIPKPNIPNPLDEAAKRERELREAAERARKAAEERARQVAEEARKQAARVAELRAQAQRVVNDFNRMKEEAQKTQREIDRIRKLVDNKEFDPQKEAHRALIASGVLGSNKDSVVRGINSGLSVVIWGKEFDHFEQQKLASALAASVATANPGPALVYIKQFALQTKAAVLRSLKSAPSRVRQKVEAEFEMLLVRGLNAAINGQQPPSFGIEGAELTVKLATYNHWVNIRFNQPRLVQTEKILGVQMYRIATDPVSRTVPLPNTFQPYLKLEVRTR